MRISKENGEHNGTSPNEYPGFQRGSGDGYVGWLRYFPGWEYKHLTAEDLMADDWEFYDERLNQALEDVDCETGRVA